MFIDIAIFKYYYRINYHKGESYEKGYSNKSSPSGYPLFKVAGEIIRGEL